LFQSSRSLACISSIVIGLLVELERDCVVCVMIS
jgi:hypothetical protein